MGTLIDNNPNISMPPHRVVLSDMLQFKCGGCGTVVAKLDGAFDFEQLPSELHELAVSLLLQRRISLNLNCGCRPVPPEDDPAEIRRLEELRKPHKFPWWLMGLGLSTGPIMAGITTHNTAQAVVGGVGALICALAMVLQKRREGNLKA